MARQLIPLDLDHELGGALADESPGGVGVDGAYPRHAREPVAQIFGDLAHSLVVVPQHLHGIVRRSASASAVESQAAADHPHFGPGEAQAVAEHLFLDGHRDAGVLEGIREGDGDPPVGTGHPRGEAFDLRNRGQPLLEGAHQVVGALEVRTAWQLDVDQDVGVQTAHSSTPEHSPRDVVLEQIPRPSEGQQRHRHRQPGSTQREADDGGIEPCVERDRLVARGRGCGPDWAALAGSGSARAPKARAPGGFRVRSSCPRSPSSPSHPRQHARGEGRNEGEGHQQRRPQGQRHHDRQRHVEHPQLPLQVHEGHEDDKGGRGGGEDGQHHLAGALGCRAHRVPPRLPATEHALQNHDGVVHDQTEPHRQPHQREEVEGHASEVDQVQRDQHRERDRHEDDPRGAERAQKEEQHREDDEGGDQRPRAQISQLLLDVLALIVVEDHARPGEARAFQLRHPRPDRVRRAHRVGADLADHQERDRGLAIDPVVGSGLLVAVAHIRHVGDAHQSSAVLEQHRAPDLLGARDAVLDGDRPFLLARPHGPRLANKIEVVDPTVNHARRQPERADPVLVELDLDEAVASSARLNQRHAFDLREIRHHAFVEVGPERFQRVGAGVGVAQEPALAPGLELGRDIRLDENPLYGWGQLLLEGREPLGEVKAREVHVRVTAEVDLDAGGSRALEFLGDGDDLLDPLDPLDGSFDGGGEEGFHRLRGGAAPARFHVESRQPGFRQQLDGDVAPGAGSHERDRQAAHGHRHRPADASTDHGAGSPASDGTTPPPR